MMQGSEAGRLSAAGPFWLSPVRGTAKQIAAAAWASRRGPLPSPKSQSFSRSYGSILPTSLTYIILSLESVKLGDLMR